MKIIINGWLSKGEQVSSENHDASLINFNRYVHFLAANRNFYDIISRPVNFQGNAYEYLDENTNLSADGTDLRL